MSTVYDCWERLVAATLKREQLRRLALCPSFDSDSGSSFDFSSTFSFDAGKPRTLTKLCFDELKEKTCNFGSKAVIGEGPCGSVYFAQLNNGKKVAVRKLPNDVNDTEFVTHVSLLSRLKHENLVEFLGYFIDGRVRILAYEYAAMGSLEDIVHGRKAARIAMLDWMRRLRVAVDVARGLEYLHVTAQPPATHYNIQSSNVLLFQDYKAKIGDLLPHHSYPFPPPNTFDSLFYVAPPMKPPHLAPELWYSEFYHSSSNFRRTTGKGVTQKSDIYSFGVLLLELLTGRRPFDYAMPRGQQSLADWAYRRLRIDRVKLLVDPRLKGEYPERGAAKLAAVAQMCLYSFEPDARPDISIILKGLLPLLNPNI